MGTNAVHRATVEQYNVHESSSESAVEIWNDFCKLYYPSLYHERRKEKEGRRAATTTTTEGIAATTTSLSSTTTDNHNDIVTKIDNHYDDFTSKVRLASQSM